MSENGRLYAFGVKLEIHDQSMQLNSVAMLTVKGAFAGAMNLGPASDPEDPYPVGRLFAMGEDLPRIGSISSGTPAKVGDTSCTFKRDESIIESAIKAILNTEGDDGDED